MLLFKNYSLAELTYLQVKLNKTKSFRRNTKKTNSISVNEQNTQKEKDNIRKDK